MEIRSRSKPEQGYVFRFLNKGPFTFPAIYIVRCSLSAPVGFII